MTDIHNRKNMHAHCMHAHMFSAANIQNFKLYAMRYRDARTGISVDAHVCSCARHVQRE